MKKEIADKWVAALRSGEFKQARGKLADRNGFCCLGVLCTILQTEVVKYDDDGANWQFGGVDERNSAVLPPSVQKAAGLCSDSGVVWKEENDELNDELTHLNDGGASFAEIADVIERDWERL